MRNKQRKKKKRKSLAFRFFSIVFSILLVYFIIIGGLFAYSYITYNPNNPKENPNFIEEAVGKIKPSLPEYTTMLVAATDESEGRTDSIMLVSYNSVNKKISIVSIPRDIKVNIPRDMWNVMVKNFPVIANDNPSFKKINAIPNYGQEQGMNFLQEYLENLLGIKIDYYVHFNIDGFKYIIDSIGGIEFNVPVKMRHKDPDIYLNPGLQLLDGDKAEQLVRFRGYTSGDLGRAAVQQQFMQAFIEKVTSLETILSNPSAYFKTLNNHLDTNISISDILKYLPELKSFSPSNVVTYTLPGEPKYINGISFVIVSEEEVLEFAYDIFKKPTVKEGDIVYEDSFDKSIMILNGSYTSGMASKTKKLFEDNGYIVGKIGDSPNKKVEQTKIYVSKEGIGNDLQKFFTNSKIIVNPIKTAEFGYDITVIIGTKESLIEDTSENTSN